MTVVKASTLARWVGATHCRMRAAREGVPAERLARVSDSVLAALKVTKLRSVFLAITDLAIDARMPTSQVKALVTQANGAASEQTALAIVAAGREARSRRRETIAAGRKRCKTR